MSYTSLEKVKFSRANENYLIRGAVTDLLIHSLFPLSHVQSETATVHSSC